MQAQVFGLRLCQQIIEAVSGAEDEVKVYEILRLSAAQDGREFVGADVLDAVYDHLAQPDVLTILGTEVAHHVDLQRVTAFGFEEDFAVVFSSPHRSETAVHAGGQLREQNIGFTQSQIVQREQIEIDAYAMVQVERSQGRTAGQIELLTGRGGEEAFKDACLERRKPVGHPIGAMCLSMTCPPVQRIGPQFPILGSYESVRLSKFSRMSATVR